MTEKEIEKDRADKWYKLALFRRDSSRALTEHAQVKELVFQQMMQGKDAEAELEGWFGKEGELLKDCGTVWEYESLDDFVKKQSDMNAYYCVSEISRLEHRRWCYFMTSRGWRSTEKEVDEEKARAELEMEKKNKCLCTWEDLVKYKKDTCQYDLMWLLKKYRDM